MKKTYNTYKKSGVNMATADKLVKYISKISKKTYKDNNAEIKSFKNIFFQIIVWAIYYKLHLF